MSYGTSIILFHVLTATIGLISGLLSMVLRKGSGLHGAAGTVFTVSMICMGVSGAYYSAFIRSIPINIVAGLLVSYLVTTAWRAARRREGGVAPFDYAAMVFIFAVGIFGVTQGITSGGAHGIPAPVYFFMSSIALLGGVGDVRFVRRGGATGPARLIRHLWRNCVALLIGLMSFYPGQARLFPKSWRETDLLTVPHLLVLGAMLFWLVRMNRRKRVEPTPRTSSSRTLRIDGRDSSRAAVAVVPPRNRPLGQSS